MRKITLIVIFLQCVLLMLSCSRSVTTKSDVNSHENVLLFANNVSQTVKDSIFNSLKILKVNLKVSKNNPNLIWIGYDKNIPNLIINSEIGTLLDNILSLKFSVDRGAIRFKPYVCDVCIPTIYSRNSVAMTGRLAKNTEQYFNKIQGVAREGVGYQIDTNEVLSLTEYVVGGIEPASAPCRRNCCFCAKVTSNTYFYKRTTIDNRMSLFDVLDAIYWAKNTSIDVLVLPFSYKFTKEIDSIFNKVFDDIKGNKLLLVSGFGGNSDVYPAKFSNTSNNMLAIPNMISHDSSDISKLVTFTQKLFSTDLKLIDKNNLQTLLK